MPEKNNAGHRQRLRDKFLKSGLDGFHDYEIIELLLTLGTPRKDCKQSAKNALQKFGSLRAVLEADPSKLKEINGIGIKMYSDSKLPRLFPDGSCRIGSSIRILSARPMKSWIISNTISAIKTGKYFW